MFYDSLMTIQYQGGYYTAPLKNEDYGNGSFSSYYSYEGVNYVPSLKKIEDEMAEAVNDVVGTSKLLVPYTPVPLTTRRSAI